MKKKTKIVVISSILILFSVQIFSYAYEKLVNKGKYLYEEKMASLRIIALLAEREGNKEEILTQYKLLANVCEETTNTPFISAKVKRKAKRLLSETEFKLGNEEKALQICEELLEKNPHDKATLRVKANIYWQQGKRLFEEGKHTSAITKYQEIIDWDIKPELNAFFKSIIASTYRKKGDYVKAIECYQNIVDKHSNLLNWPACAIYFMADVFIQQKEIGKAKEMYEVIINKYSESSWKDIAIKELEKL